MHNRRSLLLAALLISVAALPAAQAQAAKDSSSPCASIINNEFPKAVLSNGSVQAVVYLPDDEEGLLSLDTLRLVGRRSLPHLQRPHLFWSLVQSLRSIDQRCHHRPGRRISPPATALSSLNYNEAKPGELFLKPGVGVLRKVDDSPYKFGFHYPIVDLGKWKVRVKKDQVTFTQTLQSPMGYAYVYEKTLKLDKHQPILTLEHQHQEHRHQGNRHRSLRPRLLHAR